MRLAQATHSAMQYAVKHWHYSKSMPSNAVGYSVFNDDGEWCGCILFALGANPCINTDLNINKKEVIELVRVALNGKHGKTSMAVAIALRLIKKHIPYLKAIVSYADENQGHLGTIYQATNWIYTGEYARENGIHINGKTTHRRTVNSRYNTSSLEWIRENIDSSAHIIKGKPKHKYYYLYDKSLMGILKDRQKPYPKKAAAEETESGDQPETGGLSPTLPLQL